MRRPLLKFFVSVAALLQVTAASATGYVELGASNRTHLDLTVYNANQAVVTDHRLVVLPAGELELQFSDVAMTMLPATVSISSSEASGLKVYQQNYRFDLLNRRSLLERFVGRKLKYSRSLLEGNTFEKVLREGILLSIDPEIVQFGDVIEIEPEGTISLPYLPDDLKTSPTLVFLGDNKREGEQLLRVRYHASGVAWEADYALTIEDRGDLDGWVTIHNRSGSDYEVDHLRLVAGDVNVVPTAPMPMALKESRMAMMDAGGPQGMPAVQAGDYHAYDVPGHITLLKNDMTQLRLIEAKGLQIDREFRLLSSVQRYGQPGVEERSPSIWISFENSSSNNLKVPLPAGNVRVYERKGEMDTFIGASHVPHTAAGGEVRLEVGRAFDLKAKRTQTSFRQIGERIAEVGYRLELTNAGNERAEVLMAEQFPGTWEMIKQNQSGRKTDAQTYEFTVRVPAEGKATVEYQARLTW